MTIQKITKEEYLDKGFDYTKLTKQELRQIMSENNVEDIPPITALKSTILDAYKKAIHDRIDLLQGNFSSKNIFQKEKRASIGNSTLADESILNQDSSFTKNGVESSFNRSGMSSRIAASVIDESSEINSTAFNHKQKLPFVAIPKRSQADALEAPSRRRFLTFKKLLLVAVLTLCAYFKFFCPYCKPGYQFCVPLPPNSTLISDRLVCNKGFKIFRGVCDICVPDVESKNALQNKVDGYIRMLEYLKGDFKYGFAKSPRIKISIISDPEVLQKLRGSPAVIFTFDGIEARNFRVSLRAILRFYSLFLLKVSIAGIVLIILIKILLSRRRKAVMLRAQATSTSKEILEILKKQVMMSVEHPQFKSCVLVQQMKDALEIKNEVWGFVEELIRKNSNVEESLDEKGRTAWKWIGPVL